MIWKIEGSAAFQQALFRPDPLGALVESWTLAIQIQDAVDTGALRDGYGPLQPVVQAGADAVRESIDAESKAIVRTPEHYARLREFVTRWAHANPIALPFSSRPSIQPLLAEIASQEGPGAVEALAAMNATITDLSSKLDIYATSLPKSLRWQAELEAMDASDTDTGRLALAALQSADDVLGRARTVLTPEGIKELSAAAASAVHGETLAVLRDVERQRLDAFGRLFEERRAVLEAVDAQRRATLADLDAKIDHSVAEFEASSTRLLFRVGLTIGALMLVAALLAWLLGRSGVFQRSPRA